MSVDMFEISETILQVLEEIKASIEKTPTMCEDSFMDALAMDSSSACSSSSSSDSSDNMDDSLIKDIRIKMKRLQRKPKSEKKKTQHTIKTQLLTKKNPESDEDLPDDEAEDKPNLNQKYLKTKGELTIDDLEPVTRQNIQLDNSVKLVKMGQVISLVEDKLIVIKSDESCKPLNEETILFDANRRELGKIYEVFGPVQTPFYTIRFNKSSDIKEYELSVEKDALIYYAHDLTEYTKFIFNIDELRKIKGSDASWNNDNEPPKDCIEYSDDEEEQAIKRALKLKRFNNRKDNTNQSDSDESVIIPDGSQLPNGRNSKRASFVKNSTNNMNFNATNNKPDFNNNNNNNNMGVSNKGGSFMAQQSRPFQTFQNNNQFSQPIQNQFMPSVQNQFNSQFGMMPPNQQNHHQQPQGLMQQNFNQFQNWQHQNNNNQRFNTNNNMNNYNNNNSSFQGGQFNYQQNNQQNGCYQHQQPNFQYPPPNNQFIPNNFQNNFNNNNNNNWMGQTANNNNNNNNQQQQQRTSFYNQQNNSQAPNQTTTHNKANELVDKRFIQNPNLVKKSF